ncbi:CRISPR-associated protein Csh2 [Thermosipho japonicus]|uniref:CRISPR-associated protein Csh2 n=1 Tax=Thermosipho japonicus TaxID=90323 RepID=A0A841GMW7_9BACT|nr:type I CRISPR-associated protein Cas7 [Thermosipho japonicus]MBB6063335.1 CRISPR-associated protein Csh2 [Thermosipho japonicus]
MFSKRCYGIFILKSENSNWNADFTKYPRRLPDENATIFATDKSAKYAIRKYFVDLGERVFVWRTFKENGQPKSLEETYKYWLEVLKDEVKKIKIKVKNKKTKKEKEEEVVDKKDFFNKFIDVKLFGITFAVGDEQMSITGPLQISYGVNRYNVNVPYVVDIASPFRNKENDMQTTLGNEIKNLKSYYVYDFVLNPRNLPEGMEISDNEIEKLKDALKKFATNLNTTSKIGTENALLLFVTLKEGSKLVLPTMKNLVDISESEVLDLSKISELLNKYRDEIETVEVYYNENICKVNGIGESWRKGDILL